MENALGWIIMGEMDKSQSAEEENLMGSEYENANMILDVEKDVEA